MHPIDKPSPIKTKSILVYHCTSLYKIFFINCWRCGKQLEPGIHGRKGQHIRHLKNGNIRKVRLEPSEADKAHNPCQEDEQCKQRMPVSEVEIFSQSQQRNVF